MELENSYYELRKGFEKELERLIQQVGNGTPLQGYCELCPKIKIKAPISKSDSSGST